MGSSNSTAIANSTIGINSTTSENNFTLNATQNSPNLNLNGTQQLNQNQTLGQKTDSDFNLFGFDLYPQLWILLDFLSSSFGTMCSIGMITGCIVPYVPQYISIYKSRNASGFSTFVCLALLVANISRVVFWFGHPFELPLLIQSAIMILAQIFLLKLCVDVRQEREGLTLEKATLFRSGPRKFWTWTDFASYLEFIAIFTITLSSLMYLFKHYYIFVEMIGYGSLLTESMLGVPQMLKNQKNRSTEGMSAIMVALWTFGDGFKTFYYIWFQVPYQFWMCGILQSTIDIIILLQVFIFKQNSPSKSNTHEMDLRFE